ncbi:baseplate J/gp47 family protein [Acinetobacter rathckeae]|uniref:baseplate J/gp47 family protein n=1 Tax=Acinetobacter rathckeae TaxID=2605272 RepID=UPI0018A305B1|nr:baseplate J/gp47 family protein [Acinetobacter rathckeae]MBF7687091.1 baseplate J/gp47 family protein [Acinetobacter rathckeae]
MTLTTIAPQVTDSGVSAPTYFEALDYLKDQYKAIYGSDAYLENDSQDGQWLGVIARVVSDCGAACVDVYSTFSPKTATGDALSRNVAINGIKRALPTYSTVDLTITGTVGTVITNGYAIDKNNNQWTLPATVTIPPSGSIVVTATASQAGAILAMAGSVTTIGKPTRGWQGVINVASSTLGTAVEQDAHLKQRQALSVAIPSQSKTDSIKGALFSLAGVSRCKTYENDTKQTNSLGLPPNTLCVVISGGDANEIAQTMRSKKSLGCGWYGNTSVSVNDNFGEAVVVQFYRPNIRSIGFAISAQSTVDYTSDIGDSIKQAIANYVNQLDIGDKIALNKIYVPAGLYGGLDSMTYDIESIAITADGQQVSGDFLLGFNEVAYCETKNIDISIAGG